MLALDYSNYEIIIVNDGSTDKTKEVAETLVGYQKGLKGDIKVSLINKPNGGKSQALKRRDKAFESRNCTLYGW